jgi:microcystin-dependent protein/cell division protein FtsL
MSKLEPTGARVRVALDPVSAFTFTAATIVNYALTASLIAVCFSAIYFAIDASNQNAGQNVRMNSIETKETADVLGLTTLVQGVNASLCAKLMNVNASLQTEIGTLLDALNVSSSTTYNFTAFVVGQVASLQASNAVLTQAISNETSARAAKDATLMQNVSDLSAADTVLQTAIGARIKTINGQSADATNGNMLLVASGSGIAIGGFNSTITVNNTGVTSLIAGQGITASSPTGDVTVSTTAVLDVNEVTPDTTGTVFLAGASGININNTLTPNTVTIEASSLVTSITNIQADNANQMAQITALNATDSNLQMQIASITMAGQMVAAALNGTTLTFNMTLVQLITDMMTLQSQVASLQTQLANLTSVATPTGTIVPWAGSTTPPTGYLLCDGSTVAQSTYAPLYAVVGCKFCGGMTCAASNFCLPDLRGKLPVGQSNVVGSAFNQVPGTSGIGEEKHTLITSEMPSHTHAITIDLGGVHGHSLSLGAGISIDDTNQNGIYDAGETLIGGGQTIIEQKCGCAGQSTAFTFSNAGSDVNRKVFYNKNSYFNNGATEDGGHNHPASASSTGSGAAHNVVQPAVVISGYMIKY